MAEPGGTGISEADRLEAIERLKRYAVPGGALSPDELADRTRRVHLTQTLAGIDQVFAGLPPDAPPFAPAGPPPASTKPSPPPARRTSQMTALVVGAVAAVLGLGAALVLSNGPDDRTGEEAQPATTSSEPTRTESTHSRPTTTRPTTTRPPTTPTTPPLVSTTIARPLYDHADSGFAFTLLRVGQDIQPGRYIATPPDRFCYWERLSGLGGTIDDVIVNDLLISHHLIVEIVPTDAGLNSQGCAGWRPYTPPPEPETSFGDGDWLVGSDIVAGTYRTRNDFANGPPPCSWERANGFTHDHDEIVDHDLPPDGPIVLELHDGERFSTSSCGFWSLA